MQHNMTLHKETGTLTYPAKSDWDGIIKPEYYFGYSAYYIDTSVYRNNSIVVVGLISMFVGELFCSF